MAALTDITPIAKARNSPVISIFLVKISPEENTVKLYTSSVKYSKNFPSEPSYLSHSGQRCLRADVRCMREITRNNMKILGTIANILSPSATDMNSGLRIISLRMCCRQYGHLIEMGLCPSSGTFRHILSLVKNQAVLAMVLPFFTTTTTA